MYADAKNASTVPPSSRTSSHTGAMYQVGVSLLTKRPAWPPMIYAQRESAFASKVAPTGAMYEVGVSLLTKRPAWPPMIYAQR
ncbi:hypothetical protein CVE35_24535 [Pseudomonas syringae pv. actinidiae]|nr:hypothetical protein [Pseudomonas syringae pv. actinidiae]